MIKAKVNIPYKGPLYIFGLSKRNVEKLQGKEPIFIDLADVGGKGQVMIFAGDTEDSMMKDLQDGGFLPAAEAKGPAQ